MVLEEELEKYVKSEGKEIIIDWHSVNELSSAREGSYNESLYDRVLARLVELKVLSPISNNNYRIHGSGIPLNPTRGICYLYFTEEKDAVAFKAANFEGAMYSVSISKDLRT